MKKIVILLIILAIVGISGFLFYKEGNLPVNKSDTSTKVFVVAPGEKPDIIINNLSKEKLIRNRIVFYWIIRQKGIATNLQAGAFRLSPSMTADEIAEQLTHGKPLDNWVTVPEGLRKEEIAEIFSKQFAISETEFNQLAEEGYLFPETYLIPINSTAEDIITILRTTFNEKYTPELKNKASQKGLTDNEVLTLASLVEREAFGENDRQEIANILFRRLDEGMPLQIDATVQYVLGYQTDEKRWWKKELTFDDLKINSLYNTYVVKGLPPRPIANPGIAAIEAVVNATTDTPYLFYIHDPQGNTHYAKDSEGHQENIDRYLK